ncbi:MAG: hypothetical protein UW09_C0003G0113 [candidate division TM6 bacterium GW2011_GWF2_43_87]|nr:MAG: hypothetical protein UW09_C0003G0113 [candidate division TM6 bacterium GW2011_GWF2_43_87]
MVMEVMEVMMKKTVFMTVFLSLMAMSGYVGAMNLMELDDALSSSSEVKTPSLSLDEQKKFDEWWNLSGAQRCEQKFMRSLSSDKSKQLRIVRESYLSNYRMACKAEICDTLSKHVLNDVISSPQLKAKVDKSIGTYKSMVHVSLWSENGGNGGNGGFDNMSSAGPIDLIEIAEDIFYDEDPYVRMARSACLHELGHAFDRTPAYDFIGSCAAYLVTQLSKKYVSLDEQKDLMLVKFVMLEAAARCFGLREKCAFPQSLNGFHKELWKFVERMINYRNELEADSFVALSQHDKLISCYLDDLATGLKEYCDEKVAPGYSCFQLSTVVGSNKSGELSNLLGSEGSLFKGVKPSDLSEYDGNKLYTLLEVSHPAPAVRRDYIKSIQQLHGKILVDSQYVLSNEKAVTGLINTLIPLSGIFEKDQKEAIVMMKKLYAMLIGQGKIHAVSLGCKAENLAVKPNAVEVAFEAHKKYAPTVMSPAFKGIALVLKQVALKK